MLSKRVNNVSESATVATSAKAAKMTAEGKKIINFGVGEPDFTTPSGEINYAFEKAKEGFTHYTPSKGFADLRSKIAAKINKNVHNLGPDNVIVTPTKFAINLAIMAIADEEDEIIIPEPFFVSYPEICRIYGVKPVEVTSNDDFSLNIERIKNSITPRTRGVLISNPVNPTGKVFSPVEIRALQRLCIDENIYFIQDQIYEGLVYEGRVQDILELDPEMEHTVLISGFSKSYAMTGWRIGYLVASKDFINAADKFQQQTITCAPSISQMAALYALDDKESPPKMKEVFRKRRDIVVEEIQKIKGLKLIKPEGAFYVFPSYDLNISSVEFCKLALESKGLLLTPGSAFGKQGERHFRISYALSEDKLREGLALLSSFMEEQSKI
ncbi:MAG: pyridoxal phosphate-dependent aminotransferase [Candidatus Thermoplasmatota archaeon]|nr:pyridoxal phosphate-dependent aminotransferase [Candidatus Thermoplasmatota archaeon]